MTIPVNITGMVEGIRSGRFQFHFGCDRISPDFRDEKFEMIGLEDGMLPREPDLPKVQLGKTVMTRGVSEEIDPREVFKALLRHESGDWGEVSTEDHEANEEALKSDDRLLSIYRDSKGTKFYVITEADRSVTTVLLTSEY